MHARCLTIALLGVAGQLLLPGFSRADTAAPAETAVAGQRFVVHYLAGGDPASVPPVTQQTARFVLSTAEAAHSFYVGQLGLPAPLPDSAMPGLPGRRTVRAGAMRWDARWWDGKIDIYLMRMSGGLRGRALPGSTAVASAPGMFAVDYRAGPRTTAHELFHLIQFAIFRRATLDIVLGEAIANWGAYQFIARPGAMPLARATPGTVGPGSLRSPWNSLDCRTNCGTGNRRGGYDHWPFFQHLAERHGNGIIEKVLKRSAVLGAVDRKPHGLESLSGVLREHGSSLANAFAGYTAARLGGSFSHPLLAGLTLNVNGALRAGRHRARSARLVVNHLAARALIVRAGNRDRCDSSRRVRITVLGSQAGRTRSFIAQPGGKARALRQRGRRASTVTSVFPCSPARLAVANLDAVTAADQRALTVSARLLPGHR